MKKNILFILTMLVVLIFTGCGGDSTSGDKQAQAPKILNLNLETTVQKNIIDITNKKYVEFTTQNAMQLFETAIYMLPGSLGLNADEYNILLEKSKNTRYDCDNKEKGSLFISTYSDKNLIEFKFDNCLSDDLILNSLFAVKFNSKEQIGNIGIYYGSNITFLNDENNITADFIVEFDNTYENESRKFFVKAIENDSNETIQVNFEVNTTSDSTNILGTYLFENNTYFTIKSKNLTRGYFNDLVALDSKAFFDDVLDSYYGEHYEEIILSGNNSSITYKNKYNHLYYELQNIKYQYPFFADSDNNNWNNNIEDILSTNIFVSDLNITLQTATHLYWSDFITVNKNLTMNFTTNDINPFASHKVKIELVEKPLNSNLDFNKTMDVTSKFTNENNITIFRGNTIINFDQPGWYTFDAKLYDQSWNYQTVNTRIYFNEAKPLNITNKLSNNMAKEIIYLEKTHESILLDIENNKILFIIDNNITNEITLDTNIITMTLLEDNTTIAIGSEYKIYFLNTKEKNITKSLNFDGTIGHMVSKNNFLYVIGLEGGSSYIYSINIENNIIKKLYVYAFNHNYKMLLNKTLNSLYFLNDTSVNKVIVNESNISEIYSIIYPDKYFENGQVFGTNFWQLSDSKLITDFGYTYNILDTNDSTLDFKFLSSSELVSLEYTGYSYYTYIEKINGFDIDHKNNSIFLSIANSDSNNYIPDNQIDSRIEVFDYENFQYKNKYQLEKYVIYDNRTYRCIVSSIKVLNNQIMIMYQAKYFDFSTNTGGEIQDSFYFYDIIDIN